MGARSRTDRGVGCARTLVLDWQENFEIRIIAESANAEAKNRG
jgi:hypothetical protein